MDMLDKIRTDLDSASNSLAGISAFSTKDRIIVVLMILLPIALNNVLIWFLQDILITQSLVVILGYLLAPFILRKIISKDIYVLLDARETLGGSRPSVGWLWVLIAVGLPVVALLLGVWFNLFKVNLTLLAPLFNRSGFNWLYAVLASVMFAVVHPYFESRFYFGVIDAIIPPNIIGRVIIALLITLNYIGFSFALLGTHYSVAITLGFILATCFFLAYVSLHKGVNVAIFLQVALCAATAALLLLYVLARRNGTYSVGAPLLLFNPRNVLNRMF